MDNPSPLVVARRQITADHWPVTLAWNKSEELGVHWPPQERYHNVVMFENTVCKGLFKCPNNHGFWSPFSIHQGSTCECYFFRQQYFEVFSVGCFAGLGFSQMICVVFPKNTSDMFRFFFYFYFPHVSFSSSISFFYIALTYSLFSLSP